MTVVRNQGGHGWTMPEPLPEQVVGSEGQILRPYAGLSPGYSPVADKRDNRDPETVGKAIFKRLADGDDKATDAANAVLS